MARTMDRRLSEAVKRATALLQYALTTQAGCECVAHPLQAFCEADPHPTVLSIDGIGAVELKDQRRFHVVRIFFLQPSVYLWEDKKGIVHDIHQGESRELLPGERIFAYLDEARASQHNL